MPKEARESYEEVRKLCANKQYEQAAHKARRLLQRLDSTANVQIPAAPEQHESDCVDSALPVVVIGCTLTLLASAVHSADAHASVFALSLVATAHQWLGLLQDQFQSRQSLARHAAQAAAVLATSGTDEQAALYGVAEAVWIYACDSRCVHEALPTATRVCSSFMTAQSVATLVRWCTTTLLQSNHALHIADWVSLLDRARSQICSSSPSVNDAHEALEQLGSALCACGETHYRAPALAVLFHLTAGATAAQMHDFSCMHCTSHIERAQHSLESFVVHDCSTNCCFTAAAVRVSDGFRRALHRHKGLAQSHHTTSTVVNQRSEQQIGYSVWSAMYTLRCVSVILDSQSAYTAVDSARYSDSKLIVHTSQITFESACRAHRCRDLFKLQK